MKTTKPDPAGGPAEAIPSAPSSEAGRAAPPTCPACHSARFIAAERVVPRLEEGVQCCLDCGSLFSILSPGLRAFLLEKAGYER